MIKHTVTTTWWVPEETDIPKDVVALLIYPEDDMETICHPTDKEIAKHTNEFLDCTVYGLVEPKNYKNTFRLRHGLRLKYIWDNEAGVWNKVKY